MASPEQFLARVDRRTRRSTGRRPRARPRARARPTARRWSTSRARRPGTAARPTFLLDEALELRLFESFPGLSEVMSATLDALAASGNRFVLATRYETRALRALAARPPIGSWWSTPSRCRPRASRRICCRCPALRSDEAEEHAARVIVALTDGRAAYVAALVRALASAPPGIAGPGCGARRPCSRRAARCTPGAASATRCACTARAGTAPSRPSSGSSPRKSRSR